MGNEMVYHQLNLLVQPKPAAVNEKLVNVYTV